MSRIKEAFHDEIGYRAMFDRDSNLSHDEAFEILDGEGVDEITWSHSLNAEYAQWQYLNLK